MEAKVKVLSKIDRLKSKDHIEERIENKIGPKTTASPTDGVRRLKYSSEAETFKLISEKDWNMTSEPSSETTFFVDGHSAMSIISVIGSMGVGKSTLLNKIAGRKAFKTHDSPRDGSTTKHTTKGIDILATHHRILLDCQPLLSSSILEDFLSGQSLSQFSGKISDPLTSSYMINLQLVTFLIATCDFVIIKTKWLLDVNLLKIISSAMMMIGHSDRRAKLILFSENPNIHDAKLKLIVERSLGENQINRFFDKESELIDYISPYSEEKCYLNEKDSSTFSGKNWLSSCFNMWSGTIKNSSMFTEYAKQLYQSSHASF